MGSGPESGGPHLNFAELGRLSVLKLDIASGKFSEDIRNPYRDAVKDMASNVILVGEQLVKELGWAMPQHRTGIEFYNRFKGDDLTARALQETAHSGKTQDEIRGRQGLRILSVPIDPVKELAQQTKYVPQKYWEGVDSLALEFARRLGFLEHNEGVNRANKRLFFPEKGEADYGKHLDIPHVDKPFKMRMTIRHGPDYVAHIGGFHIYFDARLFPKSG